MTLISAPAGFGKTTLVSNWLDHLNQRGDVDQPPIRVAWLSLDESDNDPARFLTYFVTALTRTDKLDNELGWGTLAMLQSPESPTDPNVLIPLINDLASTSVKIIFVLDDYHMIEAKSIHKILFFLIENLPPQVHLVIATRQDPPFSLSRLRIRDQLNELRALDLRFSKSEAAIFLNQVMGLTLSTEDIAELETRTEGWIAGLQLAALSMQGLKDKRGFIKTFSGNHRLVLDFLIEEVLSQLDGDVHDFLLHTAILERLSAPLCDHLTGQKNGQEMLEMLEHTNMFIVPLDEKRTWYRYHHLFADLLKHRLRQKQANPLLNLHIKASQWFRSQGLYPEAIKHALTGKDYLNAADMIASLAMTLILLGQHMTVIDWINALPKATLRHSPNLCVLQARALQLSGELKESEALLKDAEKVLNNHHGKAGNFDDEFVGLVNSCRAYSSFMNGDLGQTISFAKKALNHLPNSATVMRAQTALYLGVAYRYDGHLQEALEVYNETLPSLNNLEVTSTTILCYLHLGELNTEMANLRKAKEIFEEALELTHQQIGRADLPFLGYVYVSIGRIMRQMNLLEEASQFITKGLALCRVWNVADILAFSCIEMAHLYQSQGDHEKGKLLLQEATQLFSQISSWGQNIAAAHQAKYNLALGDIQSAKHWAEALDLDMNGDYLPHREIEYLTLVRVLITQKRFKEAQAVIGRIFPFTKISGKKQTELELFILQSLLYYAQGDMDRAFEPLKNAFSIGEVEGYIRIFVDKGPQMASLLYEALKAGMSPGYIQQLLAAFPAGESEVEDYQSDPSGLIEPLSEREKDVLQLVAKGLTNKVIADKLYLSIHTIKTHTRNIYGKLGVNNRTQAVNKARTLGIIPPI